MISFQEQWRRQVRWHVDDNNNVRGVGGDWAARRDVHTQVIDRWSSAGHNLVDSGFDALGLWGSSVGVAVPGLSLVTGGINIARGAIKSLYGLVTGRGYLAKEGVRNMVKGAAYCVPGYGAVFAGVNLAKNSFDTVRHTAMGIHDAARYGGSDGKRQLARQWMGMGAGYGAGLATMPPQMGPIWS